MDDVEISRFAWARDFEPTPDEEKVRDHAAAGTVAEFTKEAKIRGEFLRILMLGVRKDWPVAPQGVMIWAEEPDDEDAPHLLTIEGDIDLENARAEDGRALPALSIENARFTGMIDLGGSHMKYLTIDGCRAEQLIADYAIIDRNFQADNCHFENLASIVGAYIGGQFSANSAQFENLGGNALNLQKAVIKGGVWLHNAKANGCVRASGLMTEGQLSAEGAGFKNPDGDALDLQSAVIEGGLFLKDAKTTGCIHATSLTIRGQFSANSTQLVNPDGDALNLQSAVIEGGVFLDYAKITGCVHASSLATRGQLSAEGAGFKNPDGNALNLQSAIIKGDIVLKNAKIKGCVDASGLTAEGQFSASGALFKNPDGYALNLQNALIKESVFLRKSGSRPARIQGMFYASNAGFGNLFLEQARLDSRNTDPAMDLIRAKITNDFWFDETEVNGAIEAEGIVIGGELDLSGLSPGESETPLTIDLKHARIEGALKSAWLGENSRGERAKSFDLSGAYIERLIDDPEMGWADQVILDRTEYKSIHVPKDENNNGDAKRLFESRRKWLLKEYEDGEPQCGRFKPQPFEQLTKVLRAQGETEAANLLAAEKQRLERKCTKRRIPNVLSWLLDATSSFGYSPSRALLCFFGWALIGGVAALFFDALHPVGFEPELTVGQPVSNFEPFIYALDLVTPFVEFGQASNYRIAPLCLPLPALPIFPDRAWCQALEWMQGFFSVVGYVLFSILVLTLTGVLRRD